MSQSVSRIDTVFLPTTDIQKSVDWYGEVFGFVPGFDSKDGRYLSISLPTGDPRGLRDITLMLVEDIDRDAHFGFNFFADDPEALYADLSARGLELTALRAGNGMRYFEFRDVCGNWIGVCHYPTPA